MVVCDLHLGQAFEVQRITCSATGGELRIMFRGAVSEWLQFNAKAARIDDPQVLTLEYYLQSMGRYARRVR